MHVGVLRNAHPRVWQVVALALAAVVGFTLSQSMKRTPENCVDAITHKATGTRAGFELCFDESFGYFDDIPNETWKRHRTLVHEQAPYTQPGETTDMPSWIINNINAIFPCPEMRRVGGRGDGPKFVCDPLRMSTQKKCLIYSVGSNNIYFFEDGLFDMLGTHCEIHVFDPDPSYDRPENLARNMHYHAWGLTSGSNKAQLAIDNGNGYFSIAQIMEKLGHTGRTLHIFKIDCEGCERTTYLEFLNPSMDIRQILIETHDIPRDVIVPFFNAFKHAGFTIFSSELNPYVATREVYEYGFVRLHPDFWKGGKKS